MTADERIATALESIANSLSTLTEDTKANKELKETLITNVNDMQKSIETLKEDPFGLKKEIDSVDVIYFYKLDEINIPIFVSRTSDISLNLFDDVEAQKIVNEFPEARNNLYILVGTTEFKLNI